MCANHKTLLRHNMEYGLDVAAPLEGFELPPLIRPPSCFPAPWPPFRHRAAVRPIPQVAVRWRPTD